MQFWIPIERCLSVALLLAEATLTLRLLYTGLVRRYPFFTTYLAFEISAGIVLARIPFKTHQYADVYSIYIFGLAIIRVGVAWELFERICEHFSGIGKLKYALLAILTVLGTLIAISSVNPSLVNQWGFPQTVPHLLKRYQGEIFAGVFLGMWIFFRHVLSIERRFRPNVLNHWRITTIYFAISGIQAFLVQWTGGGASVYPIDTAMLAGDLACTFAWIKLMTREGEREPAATPLPPEEFQAIQARDRELTETIISLRRNIPARIRGTRRTK